MLAGMPNLLLLWTDQQRYDTLAAAGQTVLRLPHLNRLAESATVFDRAYCTQPVCTPSRGSLVTGLYPHAHGATTNNVHLRRDVKTFAEWLNEWQTGDYATGYIGKWHLGDEIYPQHGFDEWQATDDGYVAHYSPERDRDDRSPYHHYLYDEGYQPGEHNTFHRNWQCMLPERDSKPRWQADRAIDFINRHQGRPWVLSVNTLEPHHPLPAARNGAYTPDELPVAGSFCKTPDDVPLHVRMKQRHWSQGFEHFHFGSERSWRQAMAHYWGLCEMVDDHYGRILQALADSGQWDDTLIIFTSDHGEMMGCHGLFGKQVAFDYSSRVPLIIKWPGQQEAQRVEQPVSLADLTPTICEVCGGQVPEGLHGQSLAPIGRGEMVPARDIGIVWHVRPDAAPPAWQNEADVPEDLRDLASPAALAAASVYTYRAIVTPQLRKLWVTSLGEWQLYDLAADPDELHNLASERPDEVAALRQRLVDWLGSVDDPWEVPALSESC